MTGLSPVVFLVDLDNTLFDHDEFKQRLHRWVESLPGAPPAASFWTHYEAVRADTGIVDLFETARRFSAASECPALALRMHEELRTFPLAELAYPDAAPAVEHMRSLGLPVVLCDGHEEYQRHKVAAIGLAGHFAGRILVYDHKEEHLDDVQKRFPADHYVVIDDKPRIHAAMKQALGNRVTTVLVQQGHYASAPPLLHHPPPDRTIANLSHMLRLTPWDFA